MRWRITSRLAVQNARSVTSPGTMSLVRRLMGRRTLLIVGFLFITMSFIRANVDGAAKLSASFTVFTTLEFTVPILLAGQEPVAAVGGDALGGMDRGGIAEFDGLVDVVGGQGEPVVVPQMLDVQGAVVVDVGDTLADGMAGNIEPGCVTPGVIARHVAGLVTVSEDEIRAGLRYLAAERGYVAEGAGAVAVAALLAGKVEVRGRAVAVVSGRNISLPTLAAAIT